MTRKRFFIISILTAFVLITFNVTNSSADSWQQVLQKSRDLEGYYYKTPYKFSNNHIGIMQVWHQGYHRRVEMTNSINGETMVLLTRQTDGAFYQIDPKANEGIVYYYTDVELLPQDLDETRYAVAENRFDQTFIEKVSSVEELVYQNQPVYRLENKSTHGGNEEVYRVWISKELGLPLKEEMHMADGRVHRRIYTEIQEGPFSQEIFQLPQELKIVKEIQFN
ncbi:hypothetical protein [Tindallia californiensis]|uniref:Outer membrane lipoprotein-sorting protein n=1 Tax=Tindallia californiensis TaxID=159292 RepID=A0A1H3K8T4_9FIRM|nr:hypothetical protein [Tindallia californiensis]SDY48319.1 Outer membrane lipoprotein-sorting protein [Tindallia californiensis]